MSSEQIAIPYNWACYVGSPQPLCPFPTPAYHHPPHHYTMSDARGRPQATRSMSQDSVEDAGDYAQPQQNNQQLQQQQQQQPRQQEALGGLLTKGGPAGGEQKDTLKLRLDINLDIEVTIKAKIHGDVTLSLLE
ncbi:hypothetical protein CYLTODRAFT_19350 [Cylindrobasidium torrendii FP15055 ss-10]|uniref:Uncharacterized protein n=1 Tax=Cylindrobasidium torrendii FP15055 ss-10 TaxID=1314674 RepID=A0A0D7BSW3_9AGAR|nr:hypothetical protein CYLTODRAFT_19350 [Cylindrobasidium torrendii FP15055 ss-10]